MSNIEPHIRLSSDLGIHCALLAGDPGRISRVAGFLDKPEELACNREFRSIRGLYRGVPVLAMSTGIGGASMGIAVEELSHIGVTSAIRIGSAGAYQKNVGLGELILAAGAVRDDGASKAYAPAEFPAVADPALLQACRKAAEKLGAVAHQGVVRSHDSFYTDQEEEICRRWSRLGVLGADMETAALYVISGLRGIRAASILNNVVLYEADAGEGIDQYASGDGVMARGEELEIRCALEALAEMEAGA